MQEGKMTYNGRQCSAASWAGFFIMSFCVQIRVDRAAKLALPFQESDVCKILQSVLPLSMPVIALPTRKEFKFWQVALGRLALEPLAVLASLCNSDGKEILSLNLQSLQSHVPEAELLRAAERCLMTVIAQVIIHSLLCLDHTALSETFCHNVSYVAEALP